MLAVVASTAADDAGAGAADVAAAAGAGAGVGAADEVRAEETLAVASLASVCVVVVGANCDTDSTTIGCELAATVAPVSLSLWSLFLLSSSSSSWSLAG